MAVSSDAISVEVLPKIILKLEALELEWARMTDAQRGLALVEAAIDLAGAAKELTGALPPTITQQSWKGVGALGLERAGRLHRGHHHL